MNSLISIFLERVLRKTNSYFEIINHIYIRRHKLCIRSYYVALICSSAIIVQSCSRVTPQEIPSYSTAKMVPTTSEITDYPFPVTTKDTTASNCAIDITKIPKASAGTGTIILAGYLGYSGARLDASSFLMDMQSANKTILSHGGTVFINPSSFSISPNRQRFAYTLETLDVTAHDETLHIVDADGAEQNVIATDMRQHEMLWVDNDHILIEGIKETAVMSEPRANLWLIDTLTGDKKELRNLFPNQWNGDTLEWDFTLSRVIYNQSLKRLIYPTFIEPNRVLRLIDVTTNEVIRDISTTDYGKFPSWSPDGKRFAFATQTNNNAGWDAYQDEIFTLSTYGELIQITHLSDTSGYALITSMGWSADGDSIAFWVNNTDWEKGRKGAHLSIVNTSGTNQIREYCEFHDSQGKSYRPTGDPIWSPDNQYVLINLTDPDNETKIQIIAVQVATGNIYRITEDFMAVGWLQ